MSDPFRSLRDSFLMCLQDNLTYPIHNVRYDKNDQSANIPMVGAVNVTFHNADYSVGVSEQIATVDVIFDDELTAASAASAVASVLMSTSFVTLLDYSGSTPVPVGSKKLSWDTSSLKFRPVHAENYFHLSCLIHLKLQFV